VLLRIDQSRARLENPLDVVRWNLKKTYLRDLHERGVPIVPTRWLPGLDDETLAALHDELGVEEIVVKPVVGANADDTFRLRAAAPRVETQAARNAFRGRELMVQPFVDAVVEVGEYSLFYFGDEYSHCVLKTPRAGDFRVQEEHGGLIRTVTPDTDLVEAGAKTLAAVGQTLLYARVDLVRLPDGRPALMELELIEPSLYFAFDPASPRRFSEALDRLPLEGKR
jgi:glutathione synthase/RimK-type ligase-like ATP-grasp enzyme